MFAEDYETRTGVDVKLNFAASSTLTRQIEHGARADVFLSAHPEWMDRLEQADRLAPNTRLDLLSNAIVLVVPVESFAGLTAVLHMSPEYEFDFAAAWPGRLAIADPGHVPAGMYARQSLEAMGWWDGIADQLVPAMDARAALRLVAMGEVSAGFVYASDAATSDDVEACIIFPPESYDTIRYPVAVCRGAAPEAHAFLEALASDETVALREAHGFLIPRE